MLWIRERTVSPAGNLTQITRSPICGLVSLQSALSQLIHTNIQLTNDTNTEGKAQSECYHLEHAFVPRFMKEMRCLTSFETLKQFTSQFNRNNYIYHDEVTHINIFTYI
jgi:hypothetical protein